MDKLIIVWLVFKLVVLIINEHSGPVKKIKWERSKNFIEVIIDDKHYMVEVVKPKKKKKDEN